MIVNCDRCKKSFEPEKAQKNQKKFYCNTECFRPPKLTKTCLGCGKDFKVLYKKREQKYCSYECFNPDRKVTKQCLGCEKDFTVQYKERNQKYCHNNCYWQSKRAKNMFACKQCGAEYYRSPAHEARGGGFCSVKCRGISERGEKNRAWRGGMVECTCLTCQTIFHVKQGKVKNGGGKFCSRECYAVNEDYKNAKKKHKIGKICVYCAGIYYVQPSLENRIFCSRGCADRAHASVVAGKGNGRYVHGECVGGGYHIYFPRSLRKTIYERDKYQCQICGMSKEEHGKNLCVHHIDYDKKNGSADNLISLCRFCHGKMHGGVESRAKWKKELSDLLKESESQKK